MTGNRTIHLDALLVWSARYLLVSYLGLVGLAWLGVLSTGPYLRSFFWIVCGTGAAAVVVTYRTHAATARRRLDRYLHAWIGPSARRLLYLATRSGALLLVVALFAGQYVGVVPARFRVGSYALASVLLGLTLWEERGRVVSRVRGMEAERVGAYRLGLGLLLVAAVGIYFYRLGFQHLHGDEHQVVAAAAGFYHTGEFHMWNWITGEPRPVVYDRAWPHTVLVAASYAVFGISEWSSRFPSAVAGVLSVPVSYFVARFFTERRLVALATSAALLFHPMFVDFFRWTRMYALLVPLFLVLAYFVFRTLTEENALDLGNERVNRFVDANLNFNLGLGLLTLPVLYLGSQVHLNALFVVPVGYLFVLYRAAETGERRYLVASAIGAVGLLATVALVVFTDRLEFLSNFVSPFARRNTVYVEYLFGVPFGLGLGAALFLVGLLPLSLLQTGRLRTKSAYLYLLALFSLVFLVFVGDRYAGFAYVIHVVPVVMLLTIRAYGAFSGTFEWPLVRYGLIGLLLLGTGLPLYAGAIEHDYRSQYVEDRNDFSTAYGTIVDGSAEGQAVFAQYPRRYYLRGLDEDATVVSMENDQTYARAEFHRDLRRFESGWVTWETGKSYHLEPQVRAFVDEHFVKYHGEGVDDTGVEVYYFNESMLEESGVYEGEESRS